MKYALILFMSLTLTFFSNSNADMTLEENNYRYYLSTQFGILRITDLKTSRTIERLKLGKQPVDMKIIDDTIYILYQKSKTLVLINTKTNKPTKTYDLKLTKSHIINPSPTCLFVNSENKIEVEYTDGLFHNLNELIKGD